MDFKRKKRIEERAREGRKAKEKMYEDYPWDELCKDVTKLKKPCVPELDKYIKHYGFKQHLKTSKNERVREKRMSWLFIEQLSKFKSLATITKWF